MLRLYRPSFVYRSIRHASSASIIPVQEGQPTTFVVKNGKFLRVSEKAPAVTEEITHTGQYFEEGDWRRNRYHHRTKLVNRNWAVRMVAEIPPIEVEGRIAVCDGRGSPDCPAALGHPRVYMNLDKGTVVTCMYCGLRFVKKKSE